MFLTPQISEGRSPDLELFGEPPELYPVEARVSAHETIPLEGQKAWVFGDNESVVVGDTFESVSHHEAFSRLHGGLVDNFSEEIVKVETGVANGTVRARVTWTLWGPGNEWTINGEKWMLLLRAFNSYDSFFPLSVELGLVNTAYSGKITFRETQVRQRRRGDDPVGKFVEKAVGLVESASGLIEPELERLRSTPVAYEEVPEYLEEITQKWITLDGYEEVNLRFQAEERKSLLDLVGILGWYCTNRLTCIGRQIVYRQELLYREIAHVAGI